MPGIQGIASEHRRSNNYSIDNKKVQMNNKRDIRTNEYLRLIPGAVVILFLGIFMFNLLSFNSSSDVDATEIDGNLETVAAIQTADVDAVEKEVDALDAKNIIKNSKS